MKRKQHSLKVTLDVRPGQGSSGLPAGIYCQTKGSMQLLKERDEAHKKRKDEMACTSSDLADLSLLKVQ
jgi:hypothetical protein